MSTYEEALSIIQRLTPAEQTRLLEALTALIRLPTAVEDDDETIPLQEIAESEAAWQDYLAGIDPGVTSKELKLKLFGEKFD